MVNRNASGSRPLKITLNVKSSSQLVGDTAEISFEVSVFRGSSPITNQMVILKDGVSRITSGATEVPTDLNGVALLSTSFSLKENEVIKVLRVTLEGMMDEISYPVTLPAKKKGASIEEAETLMVFKYQDDETGFITFKARVLTTTGKGIKGREVNAWFRGEDISPSVTDDEGEVIMSLPEPLLEGEEDIIIFSVSEIKRPLKMKLFRKKRLIQPKAFSKHWWFKVNNGRAFIFFVLTLSALLITIFFGKSEPLINDNLFTGKSELSSVQEYYNNLFSAHGFEYKVFVNEGKKLSGTPWWVIYFFLFSSSIGYGLFAAREEVADAFEELKLKIVDQSIMTVNDPFLERLAATMSSLGIVSNKKEARFGPVSSSSSGAHPDDKDGDGQKDKRVFGSSFMSYLTLDLATDFLGSIVKRIIR